MVLNAGGNQRGSEKASCFRVLLGLAAVASYLCYLIAKPFLAPLFVAVMIAIVFHPLQLKISGLVRSPNLAAAISTTVVLLVVMIPLVFLGISISNELSDVARSLREQQGSQVRLFPHLSHLIGNAFKWLERYVSLPQFDTQETLVHGVEQISESATP